MIDEEEQRKKAIVDEIECDLIITALEKGVNDSRENLEIFLDKNRESQERMEAGIKVAKTMFCLIGLSIKINTTMQEGYRR
jgi:hypothetical protein